MTDPSVDLIAFERNKVKGAVRTDFILSAEIIVISLGTAAQEAFAVQVGVLIAIAVMMTVGVYGLVAGIVKLDDAGLFLSRHEGESGLVRAESALGSGTLRVAPLLMKLPHTEATAWQGPPEDPPAEKGSYPRESRRVERTHHLRLRLSTRHHVANRGRVPLPTARRTNLAEFSARRPARSCRSSAIYSPALVIRRHRQLGR